MCFGLTCGFCVEMKSKILRHSTHTCIFAGFISSFSLSLSLSIHQIHKFHVKNVERILQLLCIVIRIGILWKIKNVVWQMAHGQISCMQQKNSINCFITDEFMQWQLYWVAFSLTSSIANPSERNEQKKIHKVKFC